MFWKPGTLMSALIWGRASSKGSEEAAKQERPLKPLFWLPQEQTSSELGLHILSPIKLWHSHCLCFHLFLNSSFSRCFWIQDYVLFYKTMSHLTEQIRTGPVLAPVLTQRLLTDALVQSDALWLVLRRSPEMTSFAYGWGQCASTLRNVEVSMGCPRNFSSGLFSQKSHACFAFYFSYHFAFLHCENLGSSL